MARRIRRGAPTFLSCDEEIELLAHIVAMSDRGCSVDVHGLKHTALNLAVLNHKDDPQTAKWLAEGVSKEWKDGFMDRWRFFLSLRYGEGLWATTLCYLS